MEDPSSSSEIGSDSETEQSDPDSDDSDLYGDLESSPSQELPRNISSYSDVDDSDIFLELGMPTNHGNDMSEGEPAHSVAVSSETNRESVDDDTKNKISENECKEKCTLPETKVDEKQNVRINTQRNVDAVASEITGSIQTHTECKDHMDLQGSNKCKDFENMVTATVVTSEQVESGKKANPKSICDAGERRNLPTSTNKDVQFILSYLSRQKRLFLEKSSEANMNACIPKQNRDLTLNELGPSVSDIEKLRTSPKSSGYVSESRMLRERDEKSTANLSRAKETVTDATDVVRDNNRVLSQTTSVEGEAMDLNGDQRECAVDFLMRSESREGRESGSVKPTKRTRRKNEPKRKASSQMDLFEDFLFSRDTEEVSEFLILFLCCKHFLLIWNYKNGLKFD